ncbi:response regulator transcription factor [Pseudonocardia kujensis]|uniref:response regulator transcription factor n=1 Tax=Pseudonocardia kujensis TaxID=1128675 RepID=UPI001E45E5C2|nr:response regulator transcription factor [Pseudonocardia kujensis]MCE0768493.1 response regulator transcription factor [Pseudonocardia kujensis]
MARLLVVEDDDTIGRALRSSLAVHGHDVVWCTGGRDALQAGRDGRFDLVLLDLGLPDVDGIDVCRDLRLTQPDAVLVMLTARDAEMDVIIGLEAGADDYLTKPVGLAELHARVQAHLRRAETGSRAAPDDTDGATTTVLGDLVIDLAGRRVLAAGTELLLRAKEFELLARLAAQPAAAVSRETLMSEVWDEHWFRSTKTLDVHIAALRRHLADLPPGTALPRITTLRGHGYRLDPPGTG